MNINYEKLAESIREETGDNKVTTDYLRDLDTRTVEHWEATTMTKQLDVPTQHQVRIAKATLKMSDIGARIMGSMTKDEARALLTRLGIRFTE